MAPKRSRLAAWVGKRRWLLPMLEIVILALLALWLGRAYLNFDPDVVPGGNPYSTSINEYGSLVQTHHIWTWAQQCGLCALWNGSEYGGYPSFVDVHSSALHPLVIGTTLLWGVVNGSKVALIFAFWAGGVAQWWLARVLRLGWLARLWSGAMGVVGGHLASRMELGAFGLVLSTAMCSLVFAPALTVAKSGSRRDTVLLALTLASAAVAGQGYMQIGLLFTAPAFLFLVTGRSGRLLPVWREYAIAVGLALLLAAPFLVPLAHFFPNLTKHMYPNFSTQPLEYLPLNLVIRDPGFFTNEMLFKPNYPHRTALYIGWVPVLLAASCLKSARRDDQRALLYLGTSALLVFLTASGVLLSWIQPVVPGILSVRHPTMIAGLAVPPILGLAAYGLDRLWGVNWPRLRLKTGWGSKWLELIYTTQWLLLIPLIWNLVLACNFSSTWLHVMRLPAEVDAVLQALHTPSLQWVEPPYGEHRYVEPAIRKGYKLNRGFMAWFWRDRPAPDPYLAAVRGGIPPNAVEVGRVFDVLIYRFNDFREYAFVQGAGLMTRCDAFGTGGDLLVECSTSEPGTLVVRENSWSGWYAWRDQQPVPLLSGRWLQVDAPAGQHQYRFRYLPWDVPLGVLLCLLGIVLTVWQWIEHSSSRVVRAEATVQ